MLFNELFYYFFTGILKFDLGKFKGGNYPKFEVTFDVLFKGYNLFDALFNYLVYSFLGDYFVYFLLSVYFSVSNTFDYNYFNA